MEILQLQTGLVCGQATSESPEIRYLTTRQSPLSPADNSSLAFNKLLACVSVCFM